MIKIDGIRMELSESNSDLIERIAKKEGLDKKDIYLYKKSVDARHKDDVHFKVSLVAKTNNDEKYIKKLRSAIAFSEDTYDFPHLSAKNFLRPVVIGTGPAGSFAALCLAKAGAKPIIIERGAKIEERVKAVDEFSLLGNFSEETNIQFGEGGAGSFSDGKLNTGTKSPYMRKILSEYVKFGAPEEILYEAKPHIGTDVLRKVCVNLRKEVEKYGGEYLFSKKVTDIEVKNGRITAIYVPEKIEVSHVILAIGHSARDTFRMLNNRGVKMIGKPFSVGVRIEHPQELINKAQYGDFYNHKALPVADYKLASSCYTFCMCPGGYVVPATSEAGKIVTNGMSERKRDGQNANSALLVNVDEKDYGENLFDGMEFQERIEKKAYDFSSSYMAPCQRLVDFYKGDATKEFGAVLPTYKPGVAKADINKILPEKITDGLKKGIYEMNKKLSGFSFDDAVLTAPETRSSSPVRILRDEKCEAILTRGLYPAGEGAGYAGGIMSAAADGIRCAEALIKDLEENYG